MYGIVGGSEVGTNVRRKEKVSKSLSVVLNHTKKSNSVTIEGFV